MTFPITYLLRMDFTGTAFLGTPTWTDVTAYMLPGKNAGRVVDGRQDESSDVNPGQFSFTLDNRDKRFTPGDPSSPYYPHVKSGVRVQLKVTCNATTVDYYDGLADSFDAYLDADGAWGLCDVSCTDILARLGRTVPLRSILAEETVLTAPLLYVPMNDTVRTPRGGLAARALVGPPTGATIGTASTPSTQGSYSYGATGPPADTSGGLTLTDFSASDGYIYGATWTSSYPTIGAQVFCASVWFHNTVKLTGRPLVIRTVAGENLGVDISLPTTSMVVKAFCGSTFSTGTSGAFTAGQYHQIAVVVASSGTGPYTVTVNVYVDGAVLEIASASLTSNQIAAVQIGGQMVSSASSTLIPGDYAHFAAWLANVYPDFSSLYTAGSTGFAGEDTKTHIRRLISYRASGLALLTSLATYSGAVGLHEVEGASLQSAMFDAAHVEAAPLYADGAGNLVLLNRAQMTSPTSSVTLDGHDGDLTFSLRVRSDNEYVVNEYEVTGSSGNVQVAQDTTSQAAYGYYSGATEAPFNTDADALTVAQQVVASLKDPSLGASQLDVDLFALAAHNPSLVATLLGLRTGAEVTLTNLPSPFNGLSVMVQGRDLQFTTETAVLTLYTTGLGVGVASAPTGSG